MSCATSRPEPGPGRVGFRMWRVPATLVAPNIALSSLHAVTARVRWRGNRRAHWCVTRVGGTTKRAYIRLPRGSKTFARNSTIHHRRRLRRRRRCCLRACRFAAVAALVAASTAAAAVAVAFQSSPPRELFVLNTNRVKKVENSSQFAAFAAFDAMVI